MYDMSQFQISGMYDERGANASILQERQNSSTIFRLLAIGINPMP